MRTIYIAASFKAGREKQEAKAALEEAGLTCLISAQGDPMGIEGCLNRIKAADAVYVVNPEGRVGKSVCVDIGYALALGRPVFPRARRERFARSSVGVS